MEAAAGQLSQEDIQPLVKKVSEKVSGLPTGRNNSCFIDSCLVALFFHKHPFIEFLLLHSTLQYEERVTKFVYGNDSHSDTKHRQSIQKTLKRLVKNMRRPSEDSSDIVADLRLRMNECKFISRFNDNAQHDASEFLSQLFEILQVDVGVSKTNLQVFATNDLLEKTPQNIVLTTSRLQSTGCIFGVRTWDGHTATEQLLTTSEDSGILSAPLKLLNGLEYHRTITTAEFLPSTIFILHIDRGMHVNDNIPNRSPICIDVIIQANGKRFELQSVILHNGMQNAGHFTCLVKNHEQEWFLYDDGNKELCQPQGHFEKAIQSTNARSNAICLLYAY